MKRIIINIKHSLEVKAWVLMLLFFTSFVVSAQVITDPYKIYVIGQITDEISGAPVENQEVTSVSFESFNPEFEFSESYLTDFEGFFYDTLTTMENKGAFKFSTEDYQGYIVDTITYFRFTEKLEYFVFVSLSISTETISYDYQANFAFERDTSNQNPYLIHFYDKSITNNLLSWHWSFGDGYFSEEQHPVHIYDAPGIYRVKLSITGLLSSSSHLYTSEIIKVVYIDERYNFTLSGQVFYTGAPYLIDYGIAYLSRVEEEDVYIPVDTIAFDQYGCYYFPALLEGEYMIKAALQEHSSEFGDYAASYYGNTIFWQEASVIAHHEHSYDYDINLSPLGYNACGEGMISGFVFTQTGDRDCPSAEAELLLFDENDVAIACACTDENGEYVFPDLTLTTYKVYMDITGKETQAFEIELTEDSYLINDLNIIIGTSEVYGVLSAHDIINDDLDLWYGPNPVVDYLKIEFDTELNDLSQLMIYNSYGQLINSLETGIFRGQSQLEIDFSTLPAGHYFVRIISGDNHQVLPVIHR